MKYAMDSNRITYQLQRCPFCGMEVAEVWTASEAQEIPFDEERERYTIVCDWSKRGCGATCGFHESVSEAVKRWNTRVVI